MDCKMILFARRKRVLSMKRNIIRRSFWIAFLAIMLAALLGGLLASCRTQPDAFDRMFDAAAEGQVMRMSQAPLGQPKTWQEWRANP